MRLVFVLCVVAFVGCSGGENELPYSELKSMYETEKAELERLEKERDERIDYWRGRSSDFSATDEVREDAKVELELTIERTSHIKKQEMVVRELERRMNAALGKALD